MSRAFLSCPGLGEELKPLAGGESGSFSSRVVLCLQRLDLASEKQRLHVKPPSSVRVTKCAMALPDRCLVGLWRSHVPGKGPALEGLTAGSLCSILQSKKIGAVGVPHDR